MTCGDDGNIKIWDITLNILINIPLLYTISIGNPIWSCKFFIDNSFIGGDSTGKSYLYYANFSTPAYRTYYPSGVNKVNQIAIYPCQTNITTNMEYFIMGNDNDNTYISNSTSAFYISNGHILYTDIDVTNSFIAIGDSSGGFRIY
jgi:hypothetical protein